MSRRRFFQDLILGFFLCTGLLLGGSMSAQATLWIDEIGWNGAASGDAVVGSADFIEIWNDSATEAAVSDYYISDAAGNSLNWASGTIQANGFWVIVDGAGTDQTVDNTLYTFEANTASGDLLTLPGTDCPIAISTADLDGYIQNLASIIDFVAYTDGDNSPAAGVITDVNAVITAGDWDLYDTGSTANNWSATDSQPGVIISENFIRRTAYDPEDIATHWEASTSSDIGNTQVAAVNTAPTATAPTTDSQPADGTGLITVHTTIDDADDDDTCRFKVEYSLDGGNTWTNGDPYLSSYITTSPDQATEPDVTNTEEYQVGMPTNNIITSDGANTVTFKWDTQNAGNGEATIRTGDIETVQLRITPHDGTDVGSAVTSAADFTVDNAAPTCTVAATVDPIYDGSLTQTITVTYLEAMDTGTNPTISITGLLSSPYNVTGGNWSGEDKVYTVTQIITDQGEEATATINVSAATDAAGNTQEANNTETFAVDTKNPNQPTGASFDATGGTPTADYINSSNTGFTVTFTSPATEYAGTAHLYLGGSDFTALITTVVDTASYEDTLTGDGTSITELGAGANTLTVVIVDAAGNVGTASSDVIITKDIIAPATVSDLAASIGTSEGAVDLEWSAPGDDGGSGTATSYDVRYSTNTIVESGAGAEETNWADATQATGEPSPPTATMTVSGLNAGTTYYFAIKTSDEAPNESALSSPIASAMAQTKLMDQVDYSNAWGATGNGNALQCIDPDADNSDNDPVNWWNTYLTPNFANSEPPVSNDPPTTDAVSCTNLDDTDNIYAQLRKYKFDCDFTDTDGYADFNYVELRFTDSESETYIVRFDQDDGTFSEHQDASGHIVLDTENSTKDKETDNELDVTFWITFDWDFPDTTEMDLTLYACDDEPTEDTDIYDVNYDVETDVEVDSGDWSFSDGTMNPEVSATINYKVEYVGSELQPPDAQITSVDAYRDDTPDVDETPTPGTTASSALTITTETTLGDHTYSPSIVLAGDGGTYTLDSTNATMDVDRVEVTNITISTHKYQYDTGYRYWDDNDASEDAITITIAAQLDDAGTALSAGTVKVGYSGDTDAYGDTGAFSDGTATINVEENPASGNLITRDDITCDANGAIEGGNQIYGDDVVVTGGADKDIGWDNQVPTDATVSFTADTNSGAGIDPNTYYDDDGDLNFTVSGATDGSGSGLPTNCYAYQIDDLGYGSYTNSTSQDYTSQADGDHHCDVKVVDNVGNYAEFASSTVTVDTSNPVGHIDLVETSDYLYISDGTDITSGALYYNNTAASSYYFETTYAEVTWGNSDAWKVVFDAEWGEAENEDTATSYVSSTYNISTSEDPAAGSHWVRLVNNAGNYQEITITLTKDVTAPSGVGCSSPANNDTGISVTPTLTAQTASDSLPISYYFSLSDAEAWSEIENSDWQSETTWEPSALSSGTDYWWKVNTKDAVGNESDYGAAYKFTTLAKEIRINEVAPSETNDWIEFYVAAGGNFNGYKVYEDDALVKTFPTFDSNPATGDYIVLHEEAGADETTKSGDYWDLYGMEGLIASDRTITLKDASDNIIDFVAWANQNGSWSGSDDAVNAAITADQWTRIGASTIEFDCVYSDFPAAPAEQSIARDASSTDGSNPAKSDWSYKTSLTMGTVNGASTTDQGDGTAAITDPTTTVQAGSTGTFTIVYTADADPDDDTLKHTITIDVPTGWTAPQVGDETAAGYVTVSGGSYATGYPITTSGQKIILPVRSMGETGKETITVKYGDTQDEANAAAVATVGSTEGTNTFTVSSDDTGTNVGALTEGSPGVDVSTETTITITNWRELY